jgi:hypothetical protein
MGKKSLLQERQVFSNVLGKTREVFLSRSGVCSRGSDWRPNHESIPLGFTKILL